MKAYITILCLLVTTIALGQSNNRAAQLWADSLYNTLTLDERLGQLIMIRAHSDKGADHIASVERLIKENKVGGLCFFQGTPEKQAELSNRYQSISGIPLLVAMDAEWGLGMRLKETTISFPRQMTLGAIQNNQLVYDMGREIARQCRRLGVHVNFAPVIDVNNNSRNPVINDRSFGENCFAVTEKGFQYMQGLQDGQVMACAKHFPGHGDTDLDSHFDLPILPFDMNRLDSLELMPFRALSQHGIMSMMVAHLQVPAIDNRVNTPTTLSKNAVSTLLKEKIGFEGIIFTDGLEMKGVTKYFGDGEVEARAIEAGNDMLLLPESTPAAISAIKRYMKEGRIDSTRIAESVKKILKAKYILGLAEYTPVAVENINKELNSVAAKQLKRQLIESALTTVRNKDGLLPFQQLANLNMAALSIGTSSKGSFQRTLSTYHKIQMLQTDKDFSEAQRKQLVAQLKGKDVVVVSLHNLSRAPDKNFGVSQSTIDFVNTLSRSTKVVLVVFGSPYILKDFDNIEWVLEAYSEDVDAQELAAQALFGAFSTTGRLPVTASPRSSRDMGFNTSDLHRLRYDVPERVGLKSEKLAKLDDIAEDAINGGATPGCQILVVKDNCIVWNKSYGHYTYEHIKAVDDESIYDLASITKVAASTLSVMQLYDSGMMDIYKPLSTYLPGLKGTNKESILFRDILIHQAGLQAWVPFFKNTVSMDGVGAYPLPQYYNRSRDSIFTVEVAKDLYLRGDYVDSVRAQVYKSDLRSVIEYKYSDLGFYMIADAVQNITKKRIDNFTHDNFYRPLGMSSTCYTPLLYFPDTCIVPTEEDRYFRLQRLQGHVHDMGAAMLGGISGHAGLFSTTTDLAILGQMFLNKGEYAGIRYLNESTIKTFTTRQGGSTRRGLGFDMKELDRSKTENTSYLAPESVFGHTGFTGNCMWMDPENQIVFIFLSNRTYPDMNNNKLINQDIRLKLQTAVYQAMAKKEHR